MCCERNQSLISNKGREACSWCLGGGAQAAGRPVETVLAVDLRGKQRWSGSPATLRPEQRALAHGLCRCCTVGQQRRQWRQRGSVGACLRFGRAFCLPVAVSRWPWDSLLLPAPRVVVGRVTDIVIDEGVCILMGWIHLIFAVTALWSQRRGGKIQSKGLSSFKGPLLGCTVYNPNCRKVRSIPFNTGCPD